MSAESVSATQTVAAARQVEEGARVAAWCERRDRQRRALAAHEHVHRVDGESLAQLEAAGDGEFGAQTREEQLRRQPHNRL